MKNRIEIPVDTGSLGAYVAYPEQAGSATVVVLHEIFGINADVRQTCDWLAQEGFHAICPDLFWRLEPGVELSDATEKEWHKGFSLYQAFDFDQGLADIGAVLSFARRLPGSSGRVGVMGYCLGGLMTFRAAALQHPDAAVAYYGGATDQYLHEAQSLQTPLLMHLAGDDEYIPPAAQEAIRAALAHRPQAEVHTYPGCRHAFARHQGQHYDAHAAALANARTLRWLRDHLGSV